MSYETYQESREIIEKNYYFHSIIQAAMRKAKEQEMDINLALLQDAFPEVWKDFQDRYWAPGGRLYGDKGQYDK